MKRQTRKLERKYRRLHTAESKTAWRQQFDAQRRLYQSKFTAFWLDTVSERRRDSRSLWRTVNSLLSPPLQSTSEKLTSDQFAESFRKKRWQHTDGHCFRRSASNCYSPGGASKLFQAGNSSRDLVLIEKIASQVVRVGSCSDMATQAACTVHSKFNMADVRHPENGRHISISCGPIWTRFDRIICQLRWCGRNRKRQ